MKLFTDFDLTDYNSYRIQSTAGRVYFPESPEDIRTVFEQDSRGKVVLGGGCNVIFSKAYYDDVDFVVLDGHFARIEIDGEKIRGQAGLQLKKLSEVALDNSLSGVEIFYDIPGTVGGAVCMNAGSGDECIGNLIEEVTYFDRSEKSLRTLNKDQLEFGYRTSCFLDRSDVIVAEVLLCLKRGDPKEIRKKMEETQSRRRQKQPWDRPNAGSVFKRPPGRYVGQIMDELGLKGTTIGGAQLSTKHGGFIINYDGKATGQDVIKLIEYIKKQVREKTGVELETEQRII